MANASGGPHDDRVEREAYEPSWYRVLVEMARGAALPEDPDGEADPISC